MSLSGQSNEPKHEPWAKRIAEQFFNDIPIIPKINKGSESSVVSFKMQDDLRGIIEFLTWKTKGLGGFSGTCRAAMRIGVLVLYHVQAQRGFEVDEIQTQVEKVLESDKLLKIRNNLELFNDKIAGVHDSFLLGLITADEMHRRFDECVRLASERISPEVGQIVRRNIDELLAGKSVARINRGYSDGWGGDRRSKEHKSASNESDSY